MLHGRRAGDQWQLPVRSSATTDSIARIVHGQDHVHRLDGRCSTPAQGNFQRPLGRRLGLRSLTSCPDCQMYCYQRFRWVLQNWIAQCIIRPHRWVSLGDFEQDCVTRPRSARTNVDANIVLFSSRQDLTLKRELKECIARPNQRRNANGWCIVWSMQLFNAWSIVWTRERDRHECRRSNRCDRYLIIACKGRDAAE